MPTPVPDRPARLSSPPKETYPLAARDKAMRLRDDAILMRSWAINAEREGKEDIARLWHDHADAKQAESLALIASPPDLIPPRPNPLLQMLARHGLLGRP